MIEQILNYMENNLDIVWVIFSLLTFIIFELVLIFGEKLYLLYDKNLGEYIKIKGDNKKKKFAKKIGYTKEEADDELRVYNKEKPIGFWFFTFLNLFMFIISLVIGGVLCVVFSLLFYLLSLITIEVLKKICQLIGIIVAFLFFKYVCYSIYRFVIKRRNKK